jgi:PAS domain S-box-containing protein
MSGYERDQIVGHTLDQVNFWVDNEARARILAALEEKGEVSNEETEFRRKNGEIITVSFSAQRMVINGVLYEVSIQTDITERKRAERQLRESEEKFSTIFQTSLTP